MALRDFFQKLRCTILYLIPIDVVRADPNLFYIHFRQSPKAYCAHSHHGPTDTAITACASIGYPIFGLRSCPSHGNIHLSDHKTFTTPIARSTSFGLPSLSCLCQHVSCRSKIGIQIRRTIQMHSCLTAAIFHRDPNSHHVIIATSPGMLSRQMRFENSVCHYTFTISKQQQCIASTLRLPSIRLRLRGGGDNNENLYGHHSGSSFTREHDQDEEQEEGRVSGTPSSNGIGDEAGGNTANDSANDSMDAANCAEQNLSEHSPPSPVDEQGDSAPSDMGIRGISNNEHLPYDADSNINRNAEPQTIQPTTGCVIGPMGPTSNPASTFMETPEHPPTHEETYDISENEHTDNLNAGATRVANSTTEDEYERIHNLNALATRVASYIMEEIARSELDSTHAQPEETIVQPATQVLVERGNGVPGMSNTPVNPPPANLSITRSLVNGVNGSSGDSTSPERDGLPLADGTTSQQRPQEPEFEDDLVSEVNERSLNNNEATDSDATDIDEIPGYGNLVRVNGDNAYINGINGHDTHEEAPEPADGSVVSYPPRGIFHVYD